MSENKECKACEKFGLKPLTRNNVFYHYFPRIGGLCYTGLAVNIMNPDLLPKKDITNVLLLGTLFGSTFYLYGLPVHREIPNNKRGLYSLLGSSLFGLGSVLGWAVLRSVVPKENTALATVLGLATGGVVIKLSTDYFNDVQKIAKK